MQLADKMQQRFVPTQCVGAAIQATMYFLPIAKGVLLLAQDVGLSRLGDNVTLVLAVAFASWLFLFFQFLPSMTSPSGQRIPRWPKISRILADPTISIGEKFKATFRNWYSLLVITTMLVWITSAVFSGIPILP
jgi:hypothetical protein